MKLEPILYYYRPWRTWVGYWAHEGHQVGDCIYNATRENCLIELGTIKQEREAIL